MVNDPGLRAKYLDAEHKGIKLLMLFTHQPGGPHTTKKAIRNLDDFKGLRLRFASPTVRDLVQALGATPVGVPPTEIAEQLQKGTIDGAFMDYGGVGIAFKLGGIVRHSTELYAYVTSFGLGLNEDFWNKLPADLKKLVIDTTTGKEAEVGRAWDALDVPGKKAVMEGGPRRSSSPRPRWTGCARSAPRCPRRRSRSSTARACRRARSTQRCVNCRIGTPRPRRTSGTDSLA